MSDTFQAFRIHRENDTVAGQLEALTLDDLAPGNVVVRVEYSGINYKDALAATGAGPILRRFPLVGGVDLAGEVSSSQDARFSPGDKVIAICGGLSETRDGGYAQFARVDADMLVHVPDTLDTRAAMAIGTAGFTAALAVHRLEQNGQRPDAGPMLVTGATGGVGSIAIDILSARGYEVTALTGKLDQTAFLEALGATEVLDRNELKIGTRPLESASWAGAVDNLGGDILAWLTRTTKPWGNIASVGLAASAELHTTVMPFILRAVSLIGVNMEVPPELRESIWERLTTDLRPRHLDVIANHEVTLTELPDCFEAYIGARAVGRTIVKIG